MSTRMTVVAALAGLVILVAAVGGTPPVDGDDAPVRVFAELEGTWAGTFAGYDERGVELYRIRVRQTYRTVDETTQTVRIEDRMPDGTVITGEGRNTAVRRPDGTLRLRCVVAKSNGERVEHEGRLVRGPDGDEQLVWHSQDPQRSETFRESVRTEDGRDVYEINGMGRYGRTLMLMTGRYYRPGPRNEP